MSVSRIRKAGVAMGLSCLMAGFALAQQPFTTPGQSDGNATPDVDRYLANCWAGHNQAEIQLSQIAQREAKDSKVKEFAAKMVKEHSELSRKLQPLTTDQNGGQRNQAINQLIAIDKQIVERTTDSFKQKLEDKSGAEFDQCYIGGQVACHMQASAALDVLSKQASGQLKQLASDTKSKVDEHLKQAEQIAKQLMERQTSGQARSDRDSNVRQTSAQN
jgi:putative membrane protein